MAHFANMPLFFLLTLSVAFLVIFHSNAIENPQQVNHAPGQAHNTGNGEEPAVITPDSHGEGGQGPDGPGEGDQGPDGHGDEQPDTPSEYPFHQLLTNKMEGMKPGQCFEECLQLENGTGPCMVLCPLLTESKVRLEQLFFKADIDPRNCNANDSIGAERPLAFLLCPKKPSASPPQEKSDKEGECGENNGLFICFEGQLDGERLGEHIARAHNVSMLDPNIVARMCNMKSNIALDSDKNMSEEEKARLLSWEEKQKEEKLKMHGFQVVSLPNGIFHVRTSFSSQKFIYDLAGPGKCLYVEMFSGQPDDFFTKFNAFHVDGMKLDKEPLQFAPIEGVKLKMPRAKGLANGLGIGAECFRGPWLLGMDMFLRYRPPIYLKLVKEYSTEPTKPECVPETSFLSTMIVPVQKCMLQEEKDGEKKLVCSRKSQVNWKVAVDNASLGREQLTLNSRGEAQLNFLPQNGALDLTFAVPKQNSFEFSAQLSTTTTDITAKCWPESVQQEGTVNDTVGMENYYTSTEARIILDGNKLRQENKPQYVKPEKSRTVTIPSACWVKNVPIQDFGMVSGAFYPFVLQMSILPLNMDKDCVKIFQLAFPGSQLLLPMGKKKKT